jgi:hypothetical protein
VGLADRPEESGVDVRLNLLRKALGKNFEGMINELSIVLGFE